MGAEKMRRLGGGGAEDDWLSSEPISGSPTVSGPRAKKRNSLCVRFFSILFDTKWRAQLWPRGFRSGSFIASNAFECNQESRHFLCKTITRPSIVVEQCSSLSLQSLLVSRGRNLSAANERSRKLPVRLGATMLPPPHTHTPTHTNKQTYSKHCSRSFSPFLIELKTVMHTPRVRS